MGWFPERWPPSDVEVLGLTEFEHVERWRVAVTGRPAYERGRDVCGK